MASANQTIGDDGGEFEVDTTARVFTFTTPQVRRVRNTHASQAAAIQINAAIAAATAPLGAGGLRLVAGAVVELPFYCSSIGVIATGTGYLQIERGVS